jgi:hypothetical protein
MFCEETPRADAIYQVVSEKLFCIVLGSYEVRSVKSDVA